MKKSILLLATLAVGGAASAVVLSSSDFDSLTPGLINTQGPAGDAWFEALFDVTNGTRHNVSTITPFSGANCVRIDFAPYTGTTNQGGFVWTGTTNATPWATTYDSTTSTDQLVTATAMLRFDHPTFSGTSGGGLLGLDVYDLAGTRVARMHLQDIKSPLGNRRNLWVVSRWTGTAYGSVGVRQDTEAATNNTWMKVELTMDFVAKRFWAKLNGQNFNQSWAMDPAKTTIAEADIATQTFFGTLPDAGSPVMVLNPNAQLMADDYKVETQRRATLDGTVTFEDFALPGLPPGNQNGYYIRAKLYSGTTEVDSMIGLCTSAAGNVSIATSAPDGNYDLYVQGVYCLQKKIPVTITGGVANFGAVSLKNGDSVADNVIDLSDYTRVATAFNALLDEDPVTGGNQSSANWNATADLNFDTVVDLTDYTIVATNFNALGDVP